MYITFTSLVPAALNYCIFGLFEVDSAKIQLWKLRNSYQVHEKTKTLKRQKS